MQPDALHALIRETLEGDPFIVVSNREPYEHVRTSRGVETKKTVGGLVSVLDPLLAEVGGAWIAWGSGSADRETVDEHDTVLMPPDDPRYKLRRIWLSEEEVEKFYQGHVNQTLWPLCHIETEKVRFLRSEWDVYQTVNRRFAQAAAEELQDGKGVVWFQDYHFATAPAMLRQIQPEAQIMQFWHIPWPPWAVFRQHPQRRALLEGLLGCDLIGFHIDLYAHHFLECVAQELKLPVDMERGHVLFDDRTVRVRAFPVSVDATHIDGLARLSKIRRQTETYRRRYAPRGERIGFAVERADYTKGILLRLKAVEQLFEQYPAYRERFTLVQVTPPSRGEIPAYALYQQEMQRLIRRINDRFRTSFWRPIIAIRSAQSLESLVAFYRLADLGIVSVRQDGMNLVAKEYVAARTEEDGVLVLSEFAGAAEELAQAVRINPFDVEGFAYALHQALTMDPDDRRERMRQLRVHLFGNTVYDWMANVFREVADLRGRMGTAAVPLLDRLEEVQERIDRHKHIELFCDYDGVLTPIAPRPWDAQIDAQVQDFIIKLRDSARIHVSVISGRALSDVAELVGVPRLTYAGNHGLEISGPRAHRIHPQADTVHRILRGLYDAFREEMRAFPGVIVEDKQLGIAVHYRLAPAGDVPEVLDRAYALLRRYNQERLLRVVSGKAVFEVRPNVEWDKGKAVLWLLEVLHGPKWEENVLPLYLGDDVTDEDAFEVLRGRGITVQVGPTYGRTTAAHYRLDSTADVTVFLNWLVQRSS